MRPAGVTRATEPADSTNGHSRKLRQRQSSKYTSEAGSRVGAQSLRELTEYGLQRSVRHGCSRGLARGRRLFFIERFVLHASACCGTGHRRNKPNSGDPPTPQSHAPHGDAIATKTGRSCRSSVFYNELSCLSFRMRSDRANTTDRVIRPIIRVEAFETNSRRQGLLVGADS